jgi:hypothetical protein
MYTYGAGACQHLIYMRRQIEDQRERERGLWASKTAEEHVLVFCAERSHCRYAPRDTGVVSFLYTGST